MTGKQKMGIVLLLILCCFSGVLSADEVVLDDMIITGSACVGFDCTEGESFGFSTMVLKENNLRILFRDTSTSASFPTNDWQITTNDSNNGGDSYFGIEDLDHGTMPFRIEAGASHNGILLADTGNVGLGTSLPMMDLHVVSDNTPGFRLEQDSTGGYAEQSWDVAANETNFFVRDFTNGTLPFKVRPNAPNSSVDITENGDVGFGTATPTGYLHILRENGAGTNPNTGAGLRIETTPQSAEESLGLVVNNNGPIINAFVDEAGGQTWYVRAGEDLGTSESIYEISDSLEGTPELQLQSDGDLAIAGALSEGSSRRIKHGLTTIDPNQVLDAVSNLEINRWRYVNDRQQAEHIGPMAEDFHEAFGVGADDKHLSCIDTTGVALASIKALNEKLEQQNRELRTDNQRLLQRLQVLEAAVGQLTEKK